MARDAKMKIVVGAENQASPVLKRVSDDIGAMARSSSALGQLGQGFDLLGAAVGRLAGPLGIAVTAQSVISLGSEMARLGAQVQRQRAYFDVWSGGASIATTNLAAMRTAIGGVVADTDLMNAANKYLSMGLATNADDLAKLSEMAVMLGGSTRSATESLNEFALLLANQSILRLDTFGISGAKVRLRIEELKAATAGMTTEAAFMAAVMEEGEHKVRMLEEAGVSATTSMNDLAGAWTNLKAALGEKISPTVEIVVRTVSEMMQATTSSIQGPSWEVAAVEAQQAYQEAIRNTMLAEEKLAAVRRAGFGVKAAEEALELAQAKELEATATVRAWNAVMLAKEGYVDIGLATQRLAENTDALTDANNRLATSFFQIPAAQSWMYKSLPQTVSPDYGAGNESLYPTFQMDTSANANQLRGQLQMGESWQKTQEDANTKAASQWQQAYSKQISAVEGILDQGMTTSIKLQDMRPGGAGGIGNDPNGPFAEIYRLQAWINDGTWAETAEKFGVKDKAAGAEIVKKFQSGLWDESVTKMIDEDKIKAAVLNDKQAEAYKKAFAEKIAAATGAGTDAVAASIWGGDYTNSSAQTSKMTAQGASMAGGLITGLAKAEPDLWTAGYNAAMAMQAGWNAAQSGKPPNGTQPPNGNSGYNSKLNEYGVN